ncbi:MAG: Asp-tRNA(Asn)/Glu-tRNA(Gln) amidotransferase subunit GatC [Patescibacteria group bacterium]|nr:Asp-tRNA(Asn)/Glu-tRNA(Gln) amidotransferase subunit GatC [Patescibacteria group bacterium]
MIKREEVKHIAKLARLEIGESEIKKMQKELSKILDYINLLKEVDISEVPPTFHSIQIKNVMREDEAKPLDRKEVDKILGQAPVKKGRYVKVKEILK